MEKNITDNLREKSRFSIKILKKDKGRAQ